MERLPNEKLEYAIEVYKRTLEVTGDNGEHCYTPLDEDTLKLLEELKAYRDAEEQGLLLRLPCKVGDKVYLTEHNRLVFREKPLICIVDEFSISGIFGTDCCAILNANEPFYALHRFKTVNIKNFGTTVFLTKEEAEKKLAEMKGE